jgi:hypothetical protein
VSIKSQQDKKREGFPFTARQKRQMKGKRLTRKGDRKKVGKAPVVRRQGSGR